MQHIRDILNDNKQLSNLGKIPDYGIRTSRLCL